MVLRATSPVFAESPLLSGRINSPLVIENLIRQTVVTPTPLIRTTTNPCVGSVIVLSTWSMILQWLKRYKNQVVETRRPV